MLGSSETRYGKGVALIRVALRNTRATPNLVAMRMFFDLKDVD